MGLVPPETAHLELLEVFRKWQHVPLGRPSEIPGPSLQQIAGSASGQDKAAQRVQQPYKLRKGQGRAPTYRAGAVGAGQGCTGQSSKSGESASRLYSELERPRAIHNRFATQGIEDRRLERTCWAAGP